MFEQQLPPEVERIVWARYFSAEVLPLIRRDFVGEMIDYVCEVYCHTEDQAFRVKCMAERYAEHLEKHEDNQLWNEVHRLILRLAMREGVFAGES